MAREPIKSFSTKVVGVTYPNPDGSDRQKIIRKCRPGEALALVHEPNNRHDENAMAVRRFKMFGKLGAQLGYLSAGNAKRLVGQARKGHQFSCQFVRLLGDEGDASCGALIEIGLYEPG